MFRKLVESSVNKHLTTTSSRYVNRSSLSISYWGSTTMALLGAAYCLIVCVVSQVSADATGPPPTRENSGDTYDLLYHKGVEAYGRHRWFECLTHFKGAIEDYRFYRSTLITCRHECRNKVTKKDQNSSIAKESEDTQFFFRIIKLSNCVRKCKQTHFNGRPDVAVNKNVEEEFEMLLPYDYLQFCNYKLDNLKEAVSSAYTFLMANPKHQITLQNLMYYQRLPGIRESDFVDLERKPYQSLYIKGQEYQSVEDWDDVIKTMDQAIISFMKEENNCRLLCEGNFDHESFPEFLNAISDHYIHVLKCQNRCEEKLSYLHGEQVEDILPEMYNYLQFAYYKTNDIKNAVQAAASYLLFKPEDENMLDNKKIYIETGVTPEQIVPRPEAMTYFTRIKQTKNILKYVKENYMYAFEDDNDEIDDVSDTTPETSPPESDNPESNSLLHLSQ